MAATTTPAARDLVDRMSEPLRRYFRTESGSAGLLLLATLVALAWANSPWSDTYDTFWHTELAFRLGDSVIALDLQHWVNDGLMVFFFFVVGLEVKRELSIGELTDRHRAAVPVVAALTGLLIPALVFLAFNPSGPEAQAWGVVISTDTAFLLGVLALVGPKCSAQLRLFLLTLAVADDVGALTIIALFYTDSLDPVALLVGVGLIGVMLLLKRMQVWRGPIYFVVAIGVWIAMYHSGVHPTIAGVVIALLTPAYAPRPDEVAQAEALARSFRQSPNPEYGRAARLAFERAVSSNERLQRLYHPYSSYVIVPIFALANAGVTLDRDTVSDALGSPLSWGIVAGLVGGKLVGITLGAAGAIRFRLGTLGRGLDMGQLAGGAALSGIGFTISLFIVDLALDDEALANQARVGVLVASVLAAVLGWAVFQVSNRLRRDDPAAARPTLLDRPVDPFRDHIRGPVDAPLTLVEYGDFQCPFCGAATGSVEEVRAQLGDRLRYVFRHLPLVEVHPDAELAAQAAEAAGAQGRFWEMHDRLFAHQDALDVADLLRYADEIGLDVDRFSDDLRDSVHERRVADDAAGADASGVEGTPTFFIGGVRHRGPFDAPTIIAALEASDPTAGAAPDEPTPVA